MWKYEMDQYLSSPIFIWIARAATGAAVYLQLKNQGQPYWFVCLKTALSELFKAAETQKDQA